MFPKWFFISLFYLCEVVTCLDIQTYIAYIGMNIYRGSQQRTERRKKNHKIDKTLLFNRKCVVFIH